MAIKKEQPTDLLDEQWISEDQGQLSVDVIETNDKVIVRSAIAGVKKDDLDIFLTQDMLTVRGTRKKQKEEIGSTYHFRECYWGGFSRTIVLPAHIKPDKSKATFKNGILTITMPKAVVESAMNIEFDDDDDET